MQKKAFDEATTVLNAHPDVKLIMAICSPAVPGAAEAVKQSGRKDVKVIGLGLPNDNKRFVHAGITDSGHPVEHDGPRLPDGPRGEAVAEGKLKPGDADSAAAGSGKLAIEGDNILLGQPFTFTKENIDQFDF